MAFEEQQVIMVAMHRIIYISVSFPERHLSEVGYHFTALLMVKFTLPTHLFSDECRIAMASHRHGIVVVGTAMNISLVGHANTADDFPGHQENVGVGNICLERLAVWQ